MFFTVISTPNHPIILPSTHPMWKWGRDRDRDRSQLALAHMSPSWVAAEAPAPAVQKWDCASPGSSTREKGEGKWGSAPPLHTTINRDSAGNPRSTTHPSKAQEFFLIFIKKCSYALLRIFPIFLVLIMNFLIFFSLIYFHEGAGRTPLPWGISQLPEPPREKREREQSEGDEGEGNASPAQAPCLLTPHHPALIIIIRGLMRIC